MGFFVQFPDENAISGNFQVIHLKIPGNAHLQRISIPGDCMKETAFCAKPWGVILVNLSSNFTGIILHHRCFTACLPYDEPNSQGHLC